MKFCEECGAQLDDDVRFCEECGAEQELLITEKIIEAELQRADQIVEPELITEVSKKSQIQDTAIVTSVMSEGKERNKCKWKIVIAVVAILFAAGGLGYLFGRQVGPKNNDSQQIVSGSISLTPTAGLEATMPLTPTPTKQLHATQTPVPTVIPTQTPVPTVTPTQIPVPTVTPTQTPMPTVAPTATPIPIYSVYEGFVLGNLESSLWKLETADGIYLSLDDNPMARFGYITNGTHYYSFSFEGITVGSSDAANSYAFYGEEYYLDPVNGNYDELQLSFKDEIVTIYWAHHYGQTVKVYYDNAVSMEYATCKSDYVSYGKQSMEVSGTPVEIQKSDHLSQITENGGLIGVELYADIEDEISMRLSYNAEIYVSVIDLYSYAEAIHMDGVITKAIRYGTDECFYIVHRSENGVDFWGEPLQDLAEYDTYYEIKMKFSEEGIQLCWTLFTNDVKTLLYDGMIDVEYLERRTSVKNY